MDGVYEAGAGYQVVGIAMGAAILIYPHMATLPYPAPEFGLRSS